MDTITCLSLSFFSYFFLLGWRPLTSFPPFRTNNRHPFGLSVSGNFYTLILPTSVSKTTIRYVSIVIHHSSNSRASQTSCLQIHWWRRFVLVCLLHYIYHCKTLILIALSSLTSSIHTHTTDDDDSTHIQHQVSKQSRSRQGYITEHVKRGRIRNYCRLVVMYIKSYETLRQLLF